jgi:hypothetical protein
MMSFYHNRGRGLQQPFRRFAANAGKLLTAIADAVDESRGIV